MTKEVLFYYESRQNPNGDPGFENQPRLMADDTIMVTDVRLKRTMRDYARDALGETLFVDYGNDGSPVMADARAAEIAGGDAEDVMRSLLLKTFDVPLFGALVTKRSKTRGSGGAEKLTGPMQFGLARSVNKVRILNPTISGRFVGKEKRGAEQWSTLGKFYSVEYALIKAQGAISKSNLGRYLDDEAVAAKFDEKESMAFECLWKGTNNLITRSKYPQRSILYVEVDYSDRTYNDLPGLVVENDDLLGFATDLGTNPFDFSGLVRALGDRKDHVVRVRICAATELESDISSLKADLDALGLAAETLRI